MKPEFLSYDNLDDRKELHYLLNKLHPVRRLAFLRWCCARATLPGAKSHPEPSHTMYPLTELACRDDSASKRLTMEIYQDIWRISCQYQFPIHRACAKLVEMVRAR